MCKILFWHLPCKVGHHHVKTPEISMKFPRRLYQCLPICQTLIQVVLCHLNADLFQLKVKCHHHLTKLRKVCNLVSQLYKFLLNFLQQKVCEEYCCTIITFDDLNWKIDSSIALTMFFENFFFQMMSFVDWSFLILTIRRVSFPRLIRVFLFKEWHSIICILRLWTLINSLLGLKILSTFLWPLLFS